MIKCEIYIDSQIFLFLNYKLLSLNKFIPRWILKQNHDDKIYNDF